MNRELYGLQYSSISQSKGYAQPISVTMICCFNNFLDCKKSKGQTKSILLRSYLFNDHLLTKKLKIIISVNPKEVLWLLETCTYNFEGRFGQDR